LRRRATGLNCVQLRDWSKSWRARARKCARTCASLAN